MKKKIILGITLVLVALLSAVALVPNLRLLAQVTFMNMITTTSFEVDSQAPDQLLMSGEINSKTFKQLKKVIKDKPEVKTIVLVDVPGSLDDESNFEMCRWIRKKGLNTMLKADGHVASGGTDFFLAGQERYYQEGAKLGVHSWRDSMNNEAKDIPKDDPQHEMNRKYIEDMLGQDDFYWYTIYAASADDIYYMTPEEISDFKMYTHKVE